jgi:hypothetical protein
MRQVYRVSSAESVSLCLLYTAATLVGNLITFHEASHTFQEASAAGARSVISFMYCSVAQPGPELAHGVVPAVAVAFPFTFCMLCNVLSHA